MLTLRARADASLSPSPALAHTLASSLTHTFFLHACVRTLAVLHFLALSLPLRLARTLMALAAPLSPGDLRPARTHTQPARATPLTTVRPRPIPNSYWVTPSLVACEYPWAPGASAPKLDALLAAGVRTFVDLTEAGELSPYAPAALAVRAARLGIDPTTVEYHNFPIRDRALPESDAFVRRILAVLRECERRGRVAAVHCRGGIGRTGLVVGCWLVERGTARDGDEALRMIAAEWCTVAKCGRYPHSPETGPQFEFVRAFRRAVAQAEARAVVTH
jgi:atypical dual specificity phosphatase